MKEPLLLLHGALGSKKQFTVIKELLKDDFEIHDMDFEGHGAFNSDKEFSIQLFSDNVVDYLTQNALDKVNIFGFSMGGYVAFKTALRAPERIKRIVTLGTKLDWNPGTAAKEVKMLNPDKIEEKVPHFAKKLRYEHAQDWKEVVKKTALMMTGLAEGNKLTDQEFAQINHEVVIGLGSLDNMVTYEESKRASQLIQNASLKKLDGFVHPIDKIGTQQLVAFIQSSFVSP